MGYTTDFQGEFRFSRPLTPEETDYINNFNESRRMSYHVDKLMETYNGMYGLLNPKGDTPEDIYGVDGSYFVKDLGYSSPCIKDANQPPGLTVKYADFKDYNQFRKARQEEIDEGIAQPGLWCQWRIEDNNGQFLCWDGGEKFYEYVDWLKYLIKHFFEPWGVLLNGEVEWFGEDPADRGLIVAKDNVVTTKLAKITYE